MTLTADRLDDIPIQAPHRALFPTTDLPTRELTKEVPTLVLTDLLDVLVVAVEDGTQLPCLDNDAEIWFADTPEGVDFAKTLCGTCPARGECLAGAVQRREPWGVWGGELFLQGVVVPRKRPRGRPRKDSVAA